MKEDLQFKIGVACLFVGYPYVLLIMANGACDTSVTTCTKYDLPLWFSIPSFISILFGFLLIFHGTEEPKKNTA